MMAEIWNRVVKDGVSFPQEECFDAGSGRQFFAAQSYCGVAEEDGAVVGLNILHPDYNGRLGHISNVIYEIDRRCHGRHIDEKPWFSILQLNAVVESNVHARHLYGRLGFVLIGTLPKGFRMKDGSFENICLYYHTL